MRGNQPSPRSIITIYGSEPFRLAGDGLDTEARYTL